MEKGIELVPGMTVEEIKALFFDKKALREPSYRIYQLNSDGHRYYYRYEVDGNIKFYPSVTTLLKQVMPTPPALLDWMIANGEDGATEKRDLAAAYGTFMHGEFEKLLINRQYDFDAVPGVLLAYMERENLPEKFYGDSINKIRKDVLAFAQFVKDYNVKPLAIEIGLVHPESNYAGCIDLPCVMTDPKTGEIFTAIVDFKSGRKGFFEEHELQLHLYRPMWNVNFPDMPVSRLFNFSPKDWRTKPTYNLKDQTDSVNARKLPYLLALAAIEDEKRDNTLTIVRGVIDLDKGKISDNILTLSLAELVRSKEVAKEAPEKPASGSAIPDWLQDAEESAPESAEKPVKSAKAPKAINTTSETHNAPKTENKEKQFIRAGGAPESDRLSWEKDMADGTGIEVEKNDDGVKVTARYFEPAKPAGPTPEQIAEQAAKDNLLNAEMEF